METDTDTDEENVMRLKDAIASQGMSRIVSKPPGTRREAWSRFSLAAFRRNQFC